MDDYKEFPGTSKVWIYQSNKQFDRDDADYIKVKLDEFVSTWESHGKLLKGTFEIFHDLFVVFFVDEEGDAMCGRAQDASIQQIKQLEQELEIDLLDRMNQAYRKENQIEIAKMTDFSELIEKGVITENTIVFNNTVTSKTDFDTQWEIPLKNSWHKQLIGN